MGKKEPLLVVVSKVKAFVKKQGMRTSADFIDSLSSFVESGIVDAIDRAKKDNVATLQSRHVWK